MKYLIVKNIIRITKLVVFEIFHIKYKNISSTIICKSIKPWSLILDTSDQAKIKNVELIQNALLSSDYPIR